MDLTRKPITHPKANFQGLGYTQEYESRYDQRMNDTSITTRFGEIIATSSSTMVAQCYELYKSPQIGAITRVGDADNAAYCVVQEIRTESVDPGRRPTAMGKKVESLAQLHTENPQIEQLFKTDLDLLVVGRAQGKEIQRSLPIQPPPIHSFVYTCTLPEIRAVTAGVNFLEILLQSSQSANVSLIAECIQYCTPYQPDPQEYLTSVGRQLVRSLYMEPAKLSMVLHAIGAV